MGVRLGFAAGRAGAAGCGACGARGGAGRCGLLYSVNQNSTFHAYTASPE